MLGVNFFPVLMAISHRFLSLGSFGTVCKPTFPRTVLALHCGTAHIILLLNRGMIYLLSQ